jgi:hypothetical protein
MYIELEKEQNMPPPESDLLFLIHKLRSGPLRNSTPSE